MFSKSVLNKQQLNKPRPSELAVPSGEVSYKEYNSGLWPALTWFSAAMAVGLIMGAFLFNVAEAAEGPGGKRYFQIAPKNISMALNEFAMQADSEILFTPDIVEGKQTSGLTGEFTDGEALQKILAGSGLEYKEVDEKVFLVVDPETFEGSAESYKGKSGNVDKRVIEEITVTATKRETSLQDTAMSITAVGSEEIARRGLVGMGDYLRSIPGVMSFTDESAGKSNIVMRGIAANAQRDSVHGPTVGVYFGETPIASFGLDGAAPDIKMVDIERVEVLRGPQGTLYGSSNLGGTVRNIPVQPKLDEFEGQIKAGYSSTSGRGSDNSEVQGVLNIPLIEGKLAIRAVGYQYQNSGFYKNIGASDPEIAALVTTYGAVAVEQDDVGNSEYVGGRISALWQPVDKLSINLTYLNQDVDQDGWPAADLALGEGAFLQSRTQLRFPAGESGYTDPVFNESLSSDVEIINGVIEYDLGWANLFSSSSWIDAGAEANTDIARYFFSPVSSIYGWTVDAFIQEFRLASQFDGPFQFLGGVYYEDIERGTPTNWLIYGGEDLAANPFGNNLKILHFDFLGNFVEQKAIFGEASYELTEQLKLTVGARAFRYDRNYFINRDPDAVFTGDDGGVEKGENDVNYKAGIEYTPNEDTLLYASWSQGFRLGIPLPAVPPGSTCDQNGDGIIDGSGGLTAGERLIESDYVDSYEVGGKFTLLDNRLQINADIYQIDWEGIPIQVIFGSCAPTVNAGKARSRGAELEASLQLSDNLLINFGTAYVDAELTEDAAFVGDSGDPLPGAPDFSFNLGLQYEFLLAGYSAFIRSDYAYWGGFYNNVRELGPEIGDYGKLNMSAGITFGRVDLRLYANNLTNEDKVTWIDAEGFAESRGSFLRPRTIGLNIGYSF